MKISRVMLAASLVLGAASAVYAQDKPTTYVFGTYYQCSQGDSARADAIFAEHEAPLLKAAVAGGNISAYGYLKHAEGGTWRRAFYLTGTDLGIPGGTPGLGGRPGVVLQAGWNSAYGWRTGVSRGDVDGVLLTTTYNHQTHIDVAVGAQVAAGQVIGTSGTTGFSTGCHLHFELYVNSALVDPEPWLPPH